MFFSLLTYCYQNPQKRAKGKRKTMKKQRLIIKKGELNQLYYNVRDIGFKKIRSFTDYSLASGIQKLDLTRLKKGKIRDLFISFLEQCTSRRNRTLLLYKSYDNNYVEIRILHGFGYSWGYDVEGEFKSWLYKTYNVNRKSKTYKNILYANNVFYF